MFNVNDAHKSMTDLTQSQALRWVKIANDEVKHLMRKPEVKTWEIRHFAVKKANLALVGQKEKTDGN